MLLPVKNNPTSPPIVENIIQLQNYYFPKTDTYNIFFFLV